MFEDNRETTQQNNWIMPNKDIEKQFKEDESLTEEKTFEQFEENANIFLDNEGIDKSFSETSKETTEEIVKIKIKTRGKGEKTKKREKATARKNRKLALIREEEENTINLEKFKSDIKKDLLEEIVLKPEILSPVEKIAFNTAQRNVFSTKGGEVSVKSVDAKKENNKTVFKINKNRPFNNIGNSVFNQNK